MAYKTKDNSLKMKQHDLNVDKLQASIETLISEYRQAQTLLNEQMQAVIKHDILSLNDLVESQVEVYETLTQAELTFKSHLQSFHRSHCRDEKLSLQNVVAHLDGPTEKLDTLREELHTLVEKTERLRKQLIDLLDFAQQQNAGVFEAICTVASNESDAYDAKGKKKMKQTPGLAINQQA